MPYTTGSAADMAAVKTALVNACTSDGWTEQTDAEGKTVLSKSGIYVRITYNARSEGDALNEFFLLGRTGLDSGDAPAVVQMRDIDCSELVEHISFPVTYHIFTFTNEVYMVINFSDVYQWCAFGQSDQSGISGTGSWVSATWGNQPSYGASHSPFSLSSSHGGDGGNRRTSAGIFYGTSYASNGAANSWLNNNFETSYPWALGYGGDFADPVGVKCITELIDSQPNSFNGESVLLPIRAYKRRADSKISQIAEINNARYIRIDNYVPEQIITLGTDEWMLFPFYKKNIDNRDGGFGEINTGTFGWAIKKEP